MAGRSPSSNEMDRRFMAATIRLSRHHLGLTGTNPSVGTLIVRDDGAGPRIVGRGVTAVGGRPHAEPQALDEAGDLVLPDAATQARWRDLPLAEQMRRAPETLVLPHPRLHERAFVLVPLLDIAPQWRHPLLGRSVAEMVAALPRAERDAVVPL